MKENMNNDAYNFISEELTYYPDMPQYSAEELAAHKGDKEFWYELNETLDCFRVCDVCGEPMLEGFLVDGDAHYCSEECRRCKITDEEYMMLADDEDEESETFWTTWWDNSLSFRKQIEES